MARAGIRPESWQTNRTASTISSPRAEWLIRERYTRPERLAVAGGSNGGLLMGAALTQRPELFRAVLIQVPLLDMLRYHRFLIARLWIPEYGSADDPEQFRWLRAYSPYHQVRPGVAYPAVLLATAESDTRVDPMHARKMAARLQAATSAERPVLLRLEARAGHGAGKPLSKILAGADRQLDVCIFGARGRGLRGEAIATYTGVHTMAHNLRPVAVTMSHPAEWLALLRIVRGPLFREVAGDQDDAGHARWRAACAGGLAAVARGHAQDRRQAGFGESDRVL